MNIFTFIYFIGFECRSTENKGVLPLHYDISLYCDLPKKMFYGMLDVFVKLDNASEVLLDANMTIISVYIGTKRLKYDHQDNILKINEGLGDGKSKIKIYYSKSVDSGMYGLYVSSNGTWSTHFEPEDARRVFPCFDRPDMKATFSVKIIAPSNLTVLSNTSLKKKTQGINTENEFLDIISLLTKENSDPSTDHIINDLSTYEFETTPIMSTYLVAFLLGNLDYIEEDRVRVYTPKGMSNSGRYALDIAVDCIVFFEQFFEIPYPLKKLDLVSIPDFAMGAMENWGLVTFRESLLLYTENSSPTSLVKIAETVCHEISHQWFGNLVTMKSWDDIWLNEGFATWAAVLAMKNINFNNVKARGLEKTLVSFNFAGYFAVEMENGMFSDSFISTHPIHYKEDPNQLFDQISYQKGASIIKMIEDLRSSVFRKELKQYLNASQYGNATSNTLYRFLGVDIDKWVTNKGLPLVTISKHHELSQKKFTYLKSDFAEKVQWNIPIKIDWLNGTQEYLSLSTIQMQLAPKNNTYNLNSGGVGFYRVKYEDLDIPLNTIEVLDNVDKYKIINDAFALLIAGEYSYTFYIELISRVITYDFYVLNAIISNFNTLSNVFPELTTPIHNFIMKYPYNFKPVTMSDIMIKSMLLKHHVLVNDERAMVQSLDDTCAEHKLPRYLSMANIGKISSKDSENFPAVADKLLNIYKNSDVPDDRISALIALGFSRDGIKYIDKLGTEIKLQDSTYLFVGIKYDTHKINKLIEYTINNWVSISNKFGDLKSILSGIVEVVFDTVPTEIEQEVNVFLNRKFDGMELRIKNVKEWIDIQKKFRNKNEKEVENISKLLIKFT